MKPGRRILQLTLLALCLLSLVHISATEWLNHGGNLLNTRSFSGGTINPYSVEQGNLKLHWKFLAGFDISATPAVSHGVVYFPSWNGYLYAVNAFTGSQIWNQSLGPLTGLEPTLDKVTFSRTTPVVADDLLLIGIRGPAYAIAVRRDNGQLVWSTELDSSTVAMITTSGTYYLGGYYVGVSSGQEYLPIGECCNFRGSLLKLDAQTGRIIWQTYAIPDNGGRIDQYSGAAIWGSSPAIDVVRGAVYIATGNLYTVPADVAECQAKQNNETTPPKAPDQCVASDVHFDSIIAYDINTGDLKWATQLGGYDVYYVACTLTPNNPDCPPGPSPDADFGEAPMLLTILSNGRLRDIAVAVQKSGFTWALDRDDGSIVWFTKAGPGADLGGGGIWGAATDGVRIYTNIGNGDRLPFRLAPSNETTTAGAWVAMDANTGEILWTTANPSNDTCNAPVTVVNGVVFAGSVAPDGPLYALKASTGEVIWSYTTGATIYGGASSSYGCIYIGHGYSGLPSWTDGKYLFSFCVEDD